MLIKWNSLFESGFKVKRKDLTGDSFHKPKWWFVIHADESVLAIMVPHPVQDNIPLPVSGTCKQFQFFPFCSSAVFLFTVLHGKSFVSSSFKHLSRCTLIIPNV